MEAQSGSAAAPAPTPERYTLEEYFDFEYKATHKHEFWDGQIRAMSYTSPKHGDIQTNLSDALAACLKGKGCKRYTSDRMVFVPEYNRIFYPDVVIVCGEQEFYQYKKNMKATLNPSVIIEILSDSTEQEDRIDKWMCYRTIPSLQQYVMVQQNAQNMHSYRRRTERDWDYSYANKPEETIAILDCIVQVEAVYADVA
ncbi:MAG: Uma2 family endonuclease [Saprospiraceae bacterium]|nr:Uma2 family endonuclease [Saprospiraceae bacterium]